MEVASVPFSYTPCSRTSSLWQQGSSSSLNCIARFTTGMCWPLCGPRPLPHKQKEAKLNPRCLYQEQGTNRLNGGGRMWEGASRGECGELGGEGDSRATKASTKAAGRWEIKPPETSIYRITWRSLESGWTSVLQGELGQMKIGKSRCLSNLFKCTGLEGGTLSLNCG